MAHRALDEKIMHLSSFFLYYIYSITVYNKITNGSFSLPSRFCCELFCDCESPHVLRAARFISSVQSAVFLASSALVVSSAVGWKKKKT